MEEKLPPKSQRKSSSAKMAGQAPQNHTEIGKNKLEK